jgi:ABC-type Fe3+-hydroxamate transport system substrate-binding protein
VATLGRVTFAFILLAACTACRGDAPRRSTTSLRDDFGTPITIGAPPKRIVSLNPTTTELLFAIGASNRLVGRSQWDVFPPAARDVPSVGDALRPNIEAVLAVHPDLVILYASDENRAAYERFRQAGVATVALRIDSIATFDRDTRLIGRLTGDSARAATTVDSVLATLARVRAATKDLPPPTVFLHAWDKPIIALGGGSFMSELVDIAGARHLYADIPGPSATVAIEDVVRRNPDFLLVSPDAAPKVRGNPTWRAIPAVRDNRLLIYDTLIVGRPSVLLGAAAKSLADLIHPGVVR